MPSTIASLGILVSANVAPAMQSMDQVGAKVKDVGQTSQKEGKKTEGFMKRWAGSFAMIGAAATGALYMVVKASPLLAGAMREAQDAISLLFMTVGDALEPILRPFINTLWELSDLIIDMPAPLDALTSGFIVFGGTIVGAAGGLGLISLGLKAFGIGAATAGAGAAVLAGAFGGIVLAAGAVATALYYVSEDPTTAIIGAFTTIGTGMALLFHHPLIAAVSAIAGGFALLVRAGSDLEVGLGLAFVGIGVAATALMGHPIFAVGIGLVAFFISFQKASDEMKVGIVAAFTAIGIAASVLLANPVIAAITAIVDAYLVLVALEDKLQPGKRLFGRFGLEPPGPLFDISDITGLFQHGGYVPYTGPAILHAGEYVVPRGKVGAGVGGGAVYNVTNTFEINNPVLGSDMDVERLKQKLDELYKREMGRVA